MEKLIEIWERVLFYLAEFWEMVSRFSAQAWEAISPFLKSVWDKFLSEYCQFGAVCSDGNLTLMGGAVIVESVFSWPSLGRLIMESLGNRDYVVVQGTLLFFVTVFVVINLIVDLIYALLDPRIRLQ